MKLIIKFLLAGLLYSTAGQATPKLPVNPPAEKEACVQQLRNIFARQANLRSLSARKTCYLNYSVSVLMNNDKAARPHQSEVKVYANKHKSFFQSGEVEIYQDEKVAVSVMPAKKLIFISNRPAGLEKYQEQRLQQMGFLQDSVFSLSTVTYCGDQTLKDGTTARKISLTLTEAGVKRFNIRSVDFLMDKDEKMVKSFSVTYDKHYRIRQMACVFNVLDYDYRTDKLANPVLSTVLKDRKALLAKYKEFKLIDNRKTRP